jgi:alkylated DNA repair dioxygenase AlkB
VVAQPSLFVDPPVVPGLSVIADAIDPTQEHRVERLLDASPLAPFQFGPWEGKRLTANFGSAYDYQRARPVVAPPLPGWLETLRNEVVARLGRTPGDFVQALLIRYDPGAGIGWHRDRPQYGEIVGLSLSSNAVLRLRRRLNDGKFERRSVHLPRRSAYLLGGEVRNDWEHSIAPMEATRRSVTFRTMRT